MMQQPGRLDQLAFNVLQHLVRAHAPNVATVWDNGLSQLVQFGMGRYLPNQPVQSVQVGNFQVPVDLIASFARAVKLLPAPEVPNAPGS